MSLENCKVSFSAIRKNYYHCKKYLKEHTKLIDTDLIIPDNCLVNDNLHLFNYAWFLSRLIDKAGQKFLRWNSDLFSRNFIPTQTLKQTEIFHSPHLPIPQQINQAKHIKKFITIHDIIPILFPRYFRFNEDQLIRNTLKSIASETWIFCHSQATKNDLCSYKKEIDPSKVTVTPLAASTSFYPCNNNFLIESVKKKYGIPEGNYILSLCTLEPRKNIDLIIRSFARLVTEEKLKDLNLVLIGPKGWNYQKIFSTISNINLDQNRIIQTGFASDADLSPLYSNALVFVYPSFYEGFGLPPLEAMQCGTPVITSNTSSLPEVVGDAGILITPTDEDALCQGILSIYRDDSLRSTLKKKSIERAKMFNWSKCIDQIVACYRLP